MKGEAEKPTGHLPMSSPPIFESGELGEGACNYDMFIAGRFVVLPLYPPGLPGLRHLGVCSEGAFIVRRLAVLPPIVSQRQPVSPRDEGHLIHTGRDSYTELAGLIEYSMDHAQSVGKREVIEIHLGWECPSVPLADVLDAHDRICDCEVGECVEATESGRCCKLLQPLRDRHFAVGDIDATDEGIETIYDKGGVEAGRRYSCKVVQG